MDIQSIATLALNSLIMEPVKWIGFLIFLVAIYFHLSASSKRDDAVQDISGELSRIRGLLKNIHDEMQWNKNYSAVSQILDRLKSIEDEIGKSRS